MQQKRTVLITGSTNGIGLGIAEAFAAKGSNIVFNGLEKNGREVAFKMSNKYQVDYLFSEASMLYPKQLKDMVKQCIERFGNLDVLVNNTGIQHVSSIENFRSRSGMRSLV